MEYLRSIFKDIIKASFVLFILLFASCSGEKKPAASDFQNNAVTYESAQTDPLKNKGIGPIREIRLSPLDTAMVAKGKSKKLALIAVANKLLKQSFAIAKSGLVYDAEYRSTRPSLR